MNNMDVFLTKKEVSEQLEKWLKTHRDSYREGDKQWMTVDILLDITRDSSVTGRLPWELDDD